MTTVRIAHAEPRPGRLANGGFHTRGHLVVLADDAGHRAVPIWLQGADDLANLLQRPSDQVITDSVPQELTMRLLGAARARVTGVDIDATETDVAELSPEVAVARIGLRRPDRNPAGQRRSRPGPGAGRGRGRPVRMADALLDRLAVPVPGDDLLTPFLDRVPPAAWPGLGPAPPGWPLVALPGRPRFEPRNLDFADGLDRWDLDSWPGPEPAGRSGGRRAGLRGRHGGPSAVLSSTVARPGGSAALVQAVYADDYRGTAVTFSGEISADLPAGQAGLRLEILRHWWRGAGIREDHGLTIAGRRRDWTGYEITARIPADADLIRFGIALNGPGRIALRNPGLRITELDAGTP